MGDKAFGIIRDLPILETQAVHFLKVMEAGSVATNVFLRRIHNFACRVSEGPLTMKPNSLIL